MDDPNETSRLIGYSTRINDARFADKREKQGRTLLIAASASPLIFIAACQIAAFFYTEYSRTTWLIFRVIIGIFVMTILLIQYAKRKRDPDFEGELVKKRVRRKSRNQGFDIWETYYLHTLFFRGDDGKRHRYSEEYAKKTPPANFWSGYLNIGDRARYHTKQDYFEKYDKSRDKAIPCAGCRSFFDITLDNCPHCGAPAIKP